MIALTHIPSPNMQAGERTHRSREAIDHALAATQHVAYRRLLADCGADVVALDANAKLPDCAFIEDTAVVLDEVAILAPMGGPTRRAEQATIEPVLEEYREIVRMHPPATMDGGDVLRIGRTLLVGQSSRTNATGTAALVVIAKRYGYEVTPVPIRSCLHLKTACTALPDGRLLVNPAWIEASALAGFERVPVPEEEPWSANVSLVKDNILVAAAHPRMAERIRMLRFTVHPIDVSEFAKAEGGVTCLSLLLS